MPARLSLSLDTKNAIIERYRSGSSFDKLATEFGICAPAVRKYLKIWGEYKDRTRDGSRSPDRIEFTSDERVILIEAYQRGDSIPVIARLLHTRNAVISKFVKREGLFVKRRNIEYRNRVTDEQIKETFLQTRSIRKTSQMLFGIRQTYIHQVLSRLGVEDITAEDVYTRLESVKHDLIDLYQGRSSTIPQICTRFNISKQIFRQILKRWGVYNVSFSPRASLARKGITIKRVIEVYEQKKDLHKASEELGVSIAVISSILKRAGVPNYFTEKTHIIEENKDDIISKYQTGILSIDKIAKVYGVWKTTIYDTLKRWNVKVENRHIRRTQNIVNVHKEKIYDLYLNQSYCLREIAEMLNVSHNTVIRAVKRWKIPVPDNRLKESSLEREFKRILTEMGIQFQQYLKVESRIYDFYLPSFNLIVECNGDYWHGNSMMFSKLSPEQIKGQARDVIKTALARTHGYALYFIWEFEIKQRRGLVEDLFRHLIEGHPILCQKNPMDFLTGIPVGFISR